MGRFILKTFAVSLFLTVFVMMTANCTVPQNGNSTSRMPEEVVLDIDAVAHATSPAFYGYNSDDSPKTNGYGDREIISASTYIATLSGPGVTNGSGPVRKKVLLAVIRDGESDWWCLEDPMAITFTVSGDADVWAVCPKNTDSWTDMADGSLTVDLGGGREILLNSDNHRIDFDPLIRDHLDGASINMACRILEPGNYSVSVTASGDGLKLDAAQPGRKKALLWLDAGSDSDWFCVNADNPGLEINLQTATMVRGFILESWSGDYLPIRPLTDNEGALEIIFSPVE